MCFSCCNSILNHFLSIKVLLNETGMLLPSTRKQWWNNYGETCNQTESNFLFLGSGAIGQNLPQIPDEFGNQVPHPPSANLNPYPRSKYISVAPVV